MQWAGHVTMMEDESLTKICLFEKLAFGQWRNAGTTEERDFLKKKKAPKEPSSLAESININFKWKQMTGPCGKTFDYCMGIANHHRACSKYIRPSQILYLHNDNYGFFIIKCSPNANPKSHSRYRIIEWGYCMDVRERSTNWEYVG